MGEKINKIKYLKQKTKILLENANNCDNNELDTKEDCLKRLGELCESLNKGEGIFKIYSSQLSFFSYEDLDKMIGVAGKIIVADNCNLYNDLKNIINE